MFSSCFLKYPYAASQLNSAFIHVASMTNSGLLDPHQPLFEAYLLCRGKVQTPLLGAPNACQTSVPLANWMQQAGKLPPASGETSGEKSTHLSKRSTRRSYLSTRPCHATLPSICVGPLDKLIICLVMTHVLGDSLEQMGAYQARFREIQGSL